MKTTVAAPGRGLGGGGGAPTNDGVSLVFMFNFPCLNKDHIKLSVLYKINLRINANTRHHHFVDVMLYMKKRVDRYSK